MGKISDVMEKAARENRPIRLNKVEKRETHENVDTGPGITAVASQSIREPIVDEPAIEEVVLPVDRQARAPITATPHLAMQSKIGDSDTDATRPEKREALSEDQPHRTREHKKVSGSRTPKIDQTSKQASAVKPPAISEQPKNPFRAVKTTSQGDVQISYSRTRVQSLDPEKLRKNKIFSIFDDIETTDQIKILRTQVLKRLKDIGGNSILVTSANPYEGKTFTSINLGVSIAKEFNRTVLIIDADLRKPTKRHTAFSTEFFTLDVEVGLSDYLKGEAEIPDILINPGINKLTLIPSGQPVDNAPELLSSNRMAEMMAEIKSRYASDRLVIVDGPAMLPFPDAMILCRYVDAVLPVVEFEKTPTGRLKKMMEILKETRVLGTVLNKNKE